MRIYVQDNQGRPITDAEISVDNSEILSVNPTYGWIDFKIKKDKNHVKVRVYENKKIILEKIYSVDTELVIKKPTELLQQEDKCKKVKSEIKKLKDEYNQYKVEYAKDFTKSKIDKLQKYYNQNCYEN